MLLMKEDIDFITRQLDIHLAHVHPGGSITKIWIWN